MKKWYQIILCFAFAIILPSCEFLNVRMNGKSDIESFFLEVSSLKMTNNGIYKAYSSFYNGMFCPFAESVSDEMNFADVSSSFYRIGNFETTSVDEATAVGYILKRGYSVIANCNQVLDHADALLESYPSKAKEINDYVAQALFIRALTHFQLCLTYGQNYTYTPNASHLGIPIVLRPLGLSGEIIERADVHDTYQAVLADLEKSLPLFDTERNNVFFASQTAAKALLARVHLYMGHWDLAVGYASDVISNSGLALTPSEDYWKMFCSADENGSEAIFRLNGYMNSSSQSSFYHYEHPEVRPSDKLKRLLSDRQDVRGCFSCVMSITEDGVTRDKTFSDIIIKYTCTDKEDNSELKFVNSFILRLSEMYLIRAEALNNLNRSDDAAEDLKVIIARSLGKETSEVSLSWSSREEVDALIAAERMKELYAEGHRFFDLTRRHIGIERDNLSTFTVKKLPYPDYRMVLAIPRVEMEANPDMQQNPGY